MARLPRPSNPFRYFNTSPEPIGFYTWQKSPLSMEFGDMNGKRS